MSNQRTTKIDAQLTSKYGVTIPLSVRASLNLAPMDKVNFEVREEGILITKASPCCKICGSEENLQKVGGCFLCMECIKRVKEA